MNADRLLNKRGRAQWVVRRVFDTEFGPVTRWWLGMDGNGEDKGWGEPEDAEQFPTRLLAEAAHRVAFGWTPNWTAQRVEDAFTEVREAYARGAVAQAQGRTHGGSSRPGR